MGRFRQLIGRVRLQLRGRHHIVGWNMKAREAVSFFKNQGKTVLTFFGYMAGYENEEEMFQIVRDVLSPISRAMVNSSDILVAIGGGDVTKDELLAARELGKPIHYYPAEVKHEWAIRNAKRKGLPPPESFLGS